MLDASLLAYIDPGTGSLALQVLAATLLTVGYACRRFLTWPLRLFRQRGSEPSSDLE